MIDTPLLYGAFAVAAGFLVVGLVLGFISIFVILTSQGSVRGYGHAAAAILVSTLSLLGLVVTLFAGVSSRIRHESATDTYENLVSVVPPRGWFKGPGRMSGAVGPAGGGTESALVDRLVRTANVSGLEPRHVLRAAEWTYQDRATGEEILIWFIAVTGEAFPDYSRHTSSAPGVFMVREGQTLMGIKSARDEAVVRLAEFYGKRLNEIRASDE